MIAVDRYPHDAALGTCFLTGRFRVEDGEQVLDLGVELDALPPFGRLCLSEAAVRDMVKMLGWRLMTPALEQRVKDSDRHAADMQERYDELCGAVAGIANIPQVRAALDVIERRSAVPDPETVKAWVDSLEPAGRK